MKSAGKGETGWPGLSLLSDALALPPGRTPSEYRLANLHLYRERHDYSFVDDDAGGALIGQTYDGERHALPFGRLDTRRAALLLEQADCLYPIGVEEAEALCRSMALTTDHRDADADYIYDAAALARLDNTKAKRAQAAQFERQAVPKAEPIVPGNAHLAGVVLDGWFADVGRAAASTDLDECREALTMLRELELDGLLVRRGAEPVGFLLASAPRHGERVVHFAKGRRGEAGVYPWMFAHFASICAVPRLNFEQDLGSPGLAQAKRALAPVTRRAKMRIRRRG